MVQNSQEYRVLQTEILGHSLVRLLVRSHHSLIRLRWIARFARAFRCAHSLARSLNLLTPLLVGQCRLDGYLIIHCPKSEGVSEVSERVSAAERASKASGAG